MSTKLILYCTVVTVAFAAVCVTFAADKSSCLTAVVVLDGSPTGSWGAMLIATKNVYQSLQQGDRILVFLVKDGKASLRVSTVKDSSVGGYADFCRLVDTLHPQGWPLLADLVSALKKSIYKHILQRTGADDRVTIIIVSEGRTSHQQSQELCNFADQIRGEFQWPLLVVSNAKSTNSILLAAANDGRIRWCELAQAADITIMKKLLCQVRTSTASSCNDVSDKKSVRAVTDSAQQENSSSLPSKTRPPEPAKPVTLPETPSPENKPALAIQASAGKTPSVTKNKTADSEQKLEKVTSKLPMLSSGSARQEYAGKQESFQPNQSAASSQVAKTTSRWFTKPSIKLLAIGGGPIVCMLLVLLISGWLNAQNLGKELHAPIEVAQQQQQNQPKILMVRVNGRLHRIGDFRHFKSFHIGSAPENTIRLDDKVVAPRHVRIFRRRGKLLVRNLAKDSLVINGQQLWQHKQCQLTLPAVLTVAEDVSVHLFFDKNSIRKDAKLEGPKNGKK